METHFETRQEYIKIGNELTSLAEKQRKEKEKKEQEQRDKGKNLPIVNTTNSRTAGNGTNPAYIPPKQESKKQNNNVSESKTLNQTNDIQKSIDSQHSINRLNQPSMSMSNKSSSRPMQNNNMFNSKKF